MTITTASNLPAIVGVGKTTSKKIPVIMYGTPKTSHVQLLLITQLHGILAAKLIVLSGSYRLYNNMHCVDVSSKVQCKSICFLGDTGKPVYTGHCKDKVTSLCSG